MNVRGTIFISVQALGVLLLSACAAMTPPADVERRNVILFIGDGMGVSTVTAARIFAGQAKGMLGEEHELAFERFPRVALVKTYNTDSQVPDSAGTMSAIMTGQKTRVGFISVSAAVERDDCPASLDHALPTLLEEAEDRGFLTGIVSTARITHATPAATYAHAPNRNWESDGDLPPGAADAGCRDIARQLVEMPHGDGIDVILGGGRQQFVATGTPDPEYAELSGVRGDGRNLAESWLGNADHRRYVWNAEQFAELNPRGSDQVLGLFEPSHMQYEADRVNDVAGEPSLAELTRFAIDRLRSRGRGFFLMVEGGRIDHAHHAGNAYRALVDTVAMADAVDVAVTMTDPDETLILVTADHSHTLTINGYPRRGNPILGKVTTVAGGLATDTEGRPYTTLSYANGPGYRTDLPALDDIDTEDPDYRQVAGIPTYSETHAGEDVAAYALGRNADALGGVVEQNELYEVMRAALFGE